VIGYVTRDEETRERIREMKIGGKVDSDPLEIWMESETQRRKKKSKEQKRYYVN